MPICAYCKQDRPATREHVIPSFLYVFQKQLEKSVIGWNEVTEKMVGGEAKIKDVCATCNNEVLGGLDAYAKTFFIESGLLTYNFSRNSLTLKYDFAVLLRWLLKVSFNSSRTDGAHSYLFERHIPFILGNSTAPRRSIVAPIAYLAAPEILEKSRIRDEAFARLTQGSNRLNPFLVRICYGAVMGEAEYTLRTNIFGPLVINLLMFNEHVKPGHAATAIRRFIKLLPGAVELAHERKVVELHCGDKSWLDLYENQIRRVHALGTGGPHTLGKAKGIDGGNQNKTHSHRPFV